MPYGTVEFRRLGRKAIVIIELPDRGEPSLSGRAENLVDPAVWKTVEDPVDGELALKMTLCKPYRRRVSRRIS